MQDGDLVLQVHGSSPRLRGTREMCNGDHSRQRFIPAPAGNASPPGWSRGRATVHPRACGERVIYRWLWAMRAGSSPRLRGTLPNRSGLPAPVRFIPAPAGNACARSPGRAPPTVHPRACGERAAEPVGRVLRAGSSPRLRGTRGQNAVQAMLGRFIPAPAGNATSSISSIGPGPVHPRACGERGMTMIVEQPPPGSSPRLRGTP